MADSSNAFTEAGRIVLDSSSSNEQKGQDATRKARARVNQANTALGERGVKWWEDISGTGDEQHG